MANDLWVERQISALLSTGINSIDAQQSVTWVHRRAPVGVGAAEWIPAADDVSMPIDEAVLHDARVLWFAEKPAKVKRLLDSRGIDG